MRFYSFTNWMLRPIQQGIQPGHAAVDMLVKYPDDNSSSQAAVAWEWARDHKTFICLNGGNAANLAEVYTTLQRVGDALGLPVVAFHEDEESLCGVMTSCGIVVTEDWYALAGEVRARNFRLDRPENGEPVLVCLADMSITPITTEGADLIDVLNSCSLAQ
jgi:hypothetical protein